MVAYSVTVEDLNNGASALNTGEGQINEILGQLRSQVSGLDAGWTGQAYAQFQELYQQWQTAANNLNEALTAISQLLSKAALAYQTAEEQNIKNFAY